MSTRLAAWFPEDGDPATPLDALSNRRGLRDVGITANWRLRLDPRVALREVARAGVQLGGAAPLTGLGLRADLEGGFLRTELRVDPAEWVRRAPVSMRFALGPFGEPGAPAQIAVQVFAREPDRPPQLVASLAAGLDVPARGEWREIAFVEEAQAGIAEAASAMLRLGGATLWLSFVTRSPQAAFALAAVSLGVGGAASGPPAPRPARAVRPVAPEEPSVLGGIAAEIGDLERKLWGGLSGVAAPELARIAGAAVSHGEARARAAWELARWHASHGRHEAVLALLREAQAQAPDFAAQRKLRVLHADAALRSGRLAEAVKVIAAQRAAAPTGPDHALLAANLHLARHRAGEIDAAKAAALRLGEVNRLLAQGGLAPIGLAPGAATLAIDTLHAEAPALTDARLPRISVLMAAYNAEAHLGMAIRCMLAQSWRNLELVLVDDCSTDGTWRVMQDFAARDPRVRVFANERNMGAYLSRNRALGLATGEFVTVHDSDDWSHPQMLERQMRPLLAGGPARACFSMMARVTPDLHFAVRPTRRMADIVHRSHPSLLMARRHLEELGQWDGVRANADAELVGRATLRWGKEALVNVLPQLPLSFFLIRPESLTEQADIGLLSQAFGARHEYERQAEFMRAGATARLAPRTGRKTPFACPESLLPPHLRREPAYDLVLVSDLSLGGAVAAANLACLDAALARGTRVGLFHWPRGDLPLRAGIQPAYRERNQAEGLDILTWEQELRAGLVILHHPPILRHRLDRFPRIRAEAAGILVDVLPAGASEGAAGLYDPPAAEALFATLFGRPPVWIPACPEIRRRMAGVLGFTRIAPRDWLHALARLPAGPPRRAGGQRPPVIGRAAPDHWSSWPASVAEMDAAFGAGAALQARFLGGAQAARQLRGEGPGRWPANWEALAAEAMPLAEFLDGIDMLVDFPHPDGIADVAWTVVEAMARGLPVILPHRFAGLFGPAALYREPREVVATVRRLWASPADYDAQGARGREFVAAERGPAALAERLSAGWLAAVAPAASQDQPAIELALAGAALRIPPGTDAALLTEVLRAVRASAGPA